MLSLAGLMFTGILFATAGSPGGAPEVRGVPGPIIVRPLPTPALELDEGTISEDEPPEEPPEEESAGWDFQMPLRPYTGVSDRYGAPRGEGRIHAGIDITLQGLEGSPVYAACPGKVVFTGFNGGYGNHVVIDCGDNWTTVYAHLSEILVVAVDELDQQGVVGISGSTGFSTAEHLHFEIRYRERPVNPEDYLPFDIPPGTPLSSGEIETEPEPTEESTPEPEPASTTPPTATTSPSRTPTPLGSPSPTVTPVAP